MKLRSGIRKVLLLAVTIALAVLGCGCSSIVALVNGAAALVPRAPRKLDSSFGVTIRYANQPPIEKVLPIELYYDVQPSARGNFWSVRLVGQKDEHGETSLDVRDPKLGQIRFTLGLHSLRRLAEKREVALTGITIEGIEYRYFRSEEGCHLYKSWEDDSLVRIPYSLVVDYL